MTRFEKAVRELVREAVRDEVAKTQPKPDRLEIGITEYAAKVGKSVRTVSRAIAEGRLPFKKVGKSVFVPTNATITGSKSDE